MTCCIMSADVGTLYCATSFRSNSSITRRSSGYLMIARFCGVHLKNKSTSRVKRSSSPSHKSQSVRVLKVTGLACKSQVSVERVRKILKSENDKSESEVKRQNQTIQQSESRKSKFGVGRVTEV